MSEEYLKARRQLMLWSGIAMALIFLKIDLAKASGSVGDLLATVENKDALPPLAAGAIVYMLYRTMIAWLDQWKDPEARVSGAGVADLLVCVHLALGSLLIFACVWFAPTVTYWLEPLGYFALAGSVLLGAVLYVLTRQIERRFMDQVQDYIQDWDRLFHHTVLSMGWFATVQLLVFLQVIPTVARARPLSVCFAWILLTTMLILMPARLLPHFLVLSIHRRAGFLARSILPMANQTGGLRPGSG